ncbi:MAG TPA: outer membrane protein assembly factor BamD [Bacteroidales bacterium]|nr:outer membrane protein assembly factor BamD [Bacteroidales bacterium]
MHRFFHYTLVLIFITVAGISCTSKNVIRPGDTLPVAFEKAKNLYENGKYSEATDALETVISIGRGTDTAQEAQYLLAESYYKNHEYLLAASEYDRYTSYYPNSEKRQEVDFKNAECYWHMSPNYKLDQKYSKKAIEQFNLFISRYPDSELAKKAADYIDQMREKLAHKTFGSADLYMRMDEYEAAAIYYGLTIDQYPETAWAEHALVEQIHAYVVYAQNSVEAKQQERFQKAVDSYEKYVQLFPRGDYRSEAEDYYDMAKVGLAKAKDDASGAQLTENKQQSN